MTTELRHTDGPSPAAPSGADGPTGTGSGGTRALGLAALVGVALLAFLGLVATDPDAELGETVRLLYIHVPVAVVSYAGIFITTAGSVLFLWRKSQWWDLVAASSAEVATVFLGLTLVSGSLWGRPTWGTYWEWDARLTSTAVLFLLLLGYLAVRRTTTDPVSRGRRSAVVGILLVPNVVIVNRSVEWWRSLHQDATLFRPDPQIGDLQLFTMVLSIVVGLVIFAWLLVHRFRLGWLQDQVEDQLLDSAIAERQAERRQSGGERRPSGGERAAPPAPVAPSPEVAP